MKAAYYNEIDPYAVQWLRNLIAAGLIPDGEVDSRSIVDVLADDLRGFGQKHFFAGIGGFGLACRLAGVPEDYDIATGGFPCQPFSVAGRQLAAADDRHLWPELHRLVAQCRPAAVLGENVAGLVGLALDGVLADLEASGYACRAFVIPACAVDAPHRRDRVWILGRRMGDACGAGLPGGEFGGIAEAAERGQQARAAAAEPGRSRSGGGALADAECDGWQGARATSGAAPGLRRRFAGGGAGGGDVSDRAKLGALVDASGVGRREGRAGSELRGGRDAAAGAGFWSDAAWITGRDGKARRVPQSGIRLLDARIPARVAKLRAGGNAIVPAVAAEILKAMMGHRP